MDVDRLSKRIVLVAVVLPLCGCPAARVQVTGRPERLAVRGTYIHRVSRIRIPGRVGDFRRDEVFRYDPNCLDVGADYDLVTSSHHVAVTVHVYPGPALTSPGPSPQAIAGARALLTDAELERCKKELLRAHPQAGLVEQRDVALVDGDRSHAGKRVVLEYEDLFAGSKIPLRSSLYVFCCVDRRWTVEYRFTHPKVEDAEGEIQEFMETWRWHGEHRPQELVQQHAGK